MSIFNNKDSNKSYLKEEMLVPLLHPTTRVEDHAVGT